jgi:CHAT domain-containing protein/tetratricopeptide (TPR) repeat protein
LAPRNRLFLVPLLLLLLFGGAAAAPTPESLCRQAYAANDANEPAKAGAIALDGLKRWGASAGDDPWVWRLRAVRAMFLTNADDPRRARLLLQRPFPKSLLGTEAHLRYLESLGWVTYRLHDPSTADALMAQAQELAAKKYPEQLGRLLATRAIIVPKDTLKWAGEAVRYAMKYGDTRSEIRARSTTGNYLAAAERFDEAIGTWERMLSRARELGDQSLVEKLEGSLGWAYMELGDDENAADLFAKAHSLAIRIGDNSDALIWTYQLGNVRFRQGDLAGAGQQYRIAYDLATQKDHRQKPNVAAYLANYELRTGHLADAQKHIDESIRALQVLNDLPDEMRSRVIAGQLAAAAGRLDEGERILKDVLARSESVATKVQAHGRLAQLYVRQGNFAAAEKQFRLSISSAQKARANVGDRELRFSYFTGVEEMFDSYVDFLVARGREEEALAVTETSRAQMLEEALPDVAPPLDMRSAARATGATILCYWLGTGQSYLWIVTPQKIELVRLPPRAAVEAAVDAYQRQLLGGRGSLAMTATRGSALWQMLVAPAGPAIPKGSRVIIVPHGRLAAFNMETLVVPGLNQHYWIEDAVLSNAGSLALLARKETKSSATGRLLLVGNAPPPGPEFAPLPRAGEEMDKVGHYFDRAHSMRLSGAKATPAAYRSCSPEGFTYLHFVAHGVPTRLKPLDSAIVLASDGNSYKLYARDIAKQPITARLVTISSCHGAGTRAYAGEGLVGLGWAFLRAGAGNVVAALWEVNDDVTPELMDEFYGRLAKGNDPATALRDAKLVLVHRGYVRPRYWAPFLLYGRS